MTPVVAVSTVTVGVGVVALFTLAMVLWALVAVLRRPSWAWAEADRSKVLWTVLLVMGLFLPVLGIALAMWALIGVVPMVDRQVQVGPGIGFPGGGHR